MGVAFGDSLSIFSPSTRTWKTHTTRTQQRRSGADAGEQDAGSGTENRPEFRGGYLDGSQDE